MRRHGDHVLLEAQDLIRMNRLVRDKIEVAAFRRWYEALELDERRALTFALIGYAVEAALTRADYDAALEIGGIDAAEPWVRELTEALWSGVHPSFTRGAVGELIAASSGPHLERIFSWALFIFGWQEGRVARACQGPHCNHWWHRDLNDERVLRELLRYDPERIKRWLPWILA